MFKYRSSQSMKWSGVSSAAITACVKSSVAINAELEFVILSTPTDIRTIRQSCTQLDILLNLPVSPMMIYLNKYAYDISNARYCFP